MLFIIHSRYNYKTVLLISLALLSGCTGTKGSLYANGYIADERIAAHMDSEIAKNALEASEYESSNIEITNILSNLEITGTPNPNQLRSLVELGSTDFASIIYARELLNEAENLNWQKSSLELSNRLDSIGIKAHIENTFSKFHALLIPGWHWKTRSDTGADLKFQRKVLASFGLMSTLVKTNEHGRVEENGHIIAQAVQDAQSLNKSIILISVSKGGADTAYALGKVLNKTPYLKGWLNIGGIISGSTLVELEMESPERWLTSIGFSPETPLTAVRSLMKKEAFERNSSLFFPDNITIVNYVAMPFASNLNDKSHYSYTRLAKYGPNDGAALTHEMLVPNSHTVLEIGLDHYMRSLKAMRRAIALLFLIMEESDK